MSSSCMLLRSPFALIIRPFAGRSFGFVALPYLPFLWLCQAMGMTLCACAPLFFLFHPTLLIRRSIMLGRAKRKGTTKQDIVKERKKKFKKIMVKSIIECNRWLVRAFLIYIIHQIAPFSLFGHTTV